MIDSAIACPIHHHVLFYVVKSDGYIQTILNAPSSDGNIEWYHPGKANRAKTYFSMHHFLVPYQALDRESRSMMFSSLKWRYNSRMKEIRPCSHDSRKQ